MKQKAEIIHSAKGLFKDPDFVTNVIHDIIARVGTDGICPRNTLLECIEYRYGRFKNKQLFGKVTQRLKEDGYLQSDPQDSSVFRMTVKGLNLALPTEAPQRGSIPLRTESQSIFDEIRELVGMAEVLENEIKVLNAQVLKKTLEKDGYLQRINNLSQPASHEDSSDPFQAPVQTEPLIGKNLRAGSGLMD